MTHRIMVGDCRDGMATLDDTSIDSVVTDPPYELGFMGRKWDDSGIAYNVDVWREALRVLKPGGHLLAFGGTRTYHRLACAIEDAGFDIRDSIHWTYGSGFPKSLDVSKAIDKKRYDRDQALQVTAWIAGARDAAGITNADIDQAFGFAGMAGHWTSQKSQPSVPTLEQVPRLLAVLGVDVPPLEIGRLLIDLNGKSRQPGEAWFLREVVGVYDGDMGGLGGERLGVTGGAITAPATEAAQQWDGWGTALKPSHEPIVVARKPLEGTVANNVQKYGTGAINVDGCRVGGDEIKQARPDYTASYTTGRWPPNTVMGHAHECQRHKCAPGCPVPLLGDEAAFFPAFFYHPKAGRDERGSDNTHPTVKPLGLMRWLCRLVTPPGGTVLDPFNGSGSTGCAAVMEGFGYIGCELSEEYADIARARIEQWRGQRVGGISKRAAKNGQHGQIGLFADCEA